MNWILWVIVAWVLIAVVASWLGYKSRRRKDSAATNFTEGAPELLTDEQKIKHNEAIIALGKWDRKGSEEIGPGGYKMSAFGVFTSSEADKLFEHPTIMCRFNRTKEELASGNYGAGWYYHGTQRAVWRANMMYPECRKCVVEDPYE